MGHVLQEFRDWWEEDNGDQATSTQLERLADAAAVFEALIAPDTRTRFGMFAYRLKALDTTTVYPLILFLAEKRSSIGGTEYDGMLADIESYLVPSSRV